MQFISHFTFKRVINHFMLIFMCLRLVMGGSLVLRQRGGNTNSQNWGSPKYRPVFKDSLSFHNPQFWSHGQWHIPQPRGALTRSHTHGQKESLLPHKVRGNMWKECNVWHILGNPGDNSDALPVVLVCLAREKLLLLCRHLLNVLTHWVY